MKPTVRRRARQVLVKIDLLGVNPAPARTRLMTTRSHPLVRQVFPTGTLYIG